MLDFNDLAHFFYPYFIRIYMKAKSLLWKIEHPNFANSCYLFGTMHVQDQRAFRFNDIVIEKINQCEAFATEFNLDEAAAGMPTEYLTLPKNQSYYDFLTEKQMAKLEKVLWKQVKIELKQFETFKPLILIQMITAFLLTKDQQFPLDEYLFRVAKSLDKNLLGLESYKEQLLILEKLPLSYQFKSLVDISKNFKRFRRQLIQTTASYESADMQKIFQSAKKSAQGMRKILLYDRNVIMADRFIELAQNQSLFAAIGAGHLGGKKGILRLLKIRSCTISPVKIR